MFLFRFLETQLLEKLREVLDALYAPSRNTFHLSQGIGKHEEVFDFKNYMVKNSEKSTSVSSSSSVQNLSENENGKGNLFLSQTSTESNNSSQLSDDKDRDRDRGEDEDKNKTKENEINMKKNDNFIGDIYENNDEKSQGERKTIQPHTITWQRKSEISDNGTITNLKLDQTRNETIIRAPKFNKKRHFIEISEFNEIRTNKLNDKRVADFVDEFGGIDTIISNEIDVFTINNSMSKNNKDVGKTENKENNEDNKSNVNIIKNKVDINCSARFDDLTDDLESKTYQINLERKGENPDSRLVSIISSTGSSSSSGPRSGSDSRSSLSYVSPGVSTLSSSESDKGAKVVRQPERYENKLIKEVELEVEVEVEVDDAMLRPTVWQFDPVLVLRQFDDAINRNKHDKILRNPPNNKVIDSQNDLSYKSAQLKDDIIITESEKELGLGLGIVASAVELELNSIDAERRLSRVLQKNVGGKIF